MTQYSDEFLRRFSSYNFIMFYKDNIVFYSMGGIEIVTSSGQVRIFNLSEILLVEDTTGKGHRIKNTEQKTRRTNHIALLGKKWSAGKSWLLQSHKCIAFRRPI